jgi:hypothetical protein
MLTKKISLAIIVLVFLLSACGGDDDEGETQPTPTPAGGGAGVFNLVAESLMGDSGKWKLDPATVDLTLNADNVTLVATYLHDTSPAPGLLTITLYRTFDAAAEAFAQRRESWVADPNAVVEEISAFADAASVLNGTQSGIVRDGDAVIVVEFQGESTHNHSDLLNLMQIGVEASRRRTIPSRPNISLSDSLGSATLEPIGTPQ